MRSFPMAIFFSPIFWGTIIVLIGLGVVLRAFDIHIPIFRILLGGVLILFGIRLLSGWPRGVEMMRSETSVLFGSAKMKGAPDKGEYQTIFAQSEIDLREIPSTTPSIRSATVFGQTTILVRPDQAVSVRGEAAFGQAELPDGEKASGFGSARWKSPAWKDGVPGTELRVSVVFGEVVVKTL